MRYDKEFHFVLSKEVSNGMGGFSSEESFGSRFFANKSPVKAEVMLKEYGIVTSAAYRLITRDDVNLPLESLLLTDRTLKYKVIQMLDYKLNIFLVEVV